jgi:uridylate kinase
MLKISGEALAGKGGFGIDPDVVELFAAEVAASAKSGVQVRTGLGCGARAMQYASS